MRLFTHQFVKDCITLCVFFFVVYLITHNPVTHPTPKKVEGKWSIVLMQQPLIFGFAGHNYLSLRDDSNATYMELHGLATNKQSHTWTYVGVNPDDVLNVWEFTRPYFYTSENSHAGVVLFEGDKEKVQSIWKQGEGCIVKINSKNIKYPPLGIRINGETENSNSVAYTLTVCMHLPTDHLGIFTPGSSKDLLEESVTP